MKIYKLISLGILILFLSLGCKKSSYLDAKPDQRLVVPKSINDFQAILDNNLVMNGTVNGVVPALGEASADNYWLATSRLNSFNVLTQDLYKWELGDSWGTAWKDWEYPYSVILYSNLVLDGLKDLTASANEQQAYNNAKGSALFFRAFMFYHLAQLFSPVYNKNTATSDLGIPLRLTSDINEKISRPTLQQTYDQVINDLKEAQQLLPDFAQYKTRPSKWAVAALLSRIYLSMSDYDNALLYANVCLNLSSSLMDYNSDPDITGNFFPFKTFNKEVIFHADLLNISFPIISPGSANTDSLLFKSYDINDRRKTLYFFNLPPGQAFIGTYDGNTGNLFGGLAVDEIYFNRAECNARKNDLVNALNDLNAIMIKRWRTGTFVPFTATNSTQALNIILAERRKELLFRGVRWIDLRRLNKEGADITLSKVVNGQTYTLLPNSPKYTLLIPSNVLGFNPGMQQNYR